jgi:mRNA-degrading endonuclease toxin of MazEF toxin-antitoxin module
VLVISGPAFAAIPGLFLGLPLTTTDRGLIHHVEIPADKATGLRTVSFVMTEQIRVLSTRRLAGPSLGVVSGSALAQVEYAVKAFLDL